MKTMMFLSSFLFFFSCSHAPQSTGPVSAGNKVNEFQILSTLWFQKAAENQALFWQGYNIAKLRLAEALKKKHSKKLAVILDLDETVLDNSPYQADLILEDKDFPASWDAWVDMAKAKALPGAAEFLAFAQKNKVEIFYVTNRKVVGLQGTMQNLKDLGLPLKEENLLMRVKESSKEPRRLSVAKNYEVVLLMGDNLDDFAEDFEQKSVEDRRLAVEQHRAKFGQRFIAFPNPMYGTWQGALYQYNYARTPAERLNLHLDALVGTAESK